MLGAALLRQMPRKAVGLLVVGMLVVLSALGSALFAAADSPDPTLPLSVTFNPSTRTATVQGGWAWTTHRSDCNVDRFGVGWAVDWHDTADRGNLVGTANGQPVYVGTSADNAVHYSATAPHCGTYNAAAGYNTGSWGPLQHSYPAGTTGAQVCVVMYDIHKDAGGGPRAGGLVAGGPGHNGDNSVQRNGDAPLGNGCFVFHSPTISTQASAGVVAGNAVHDTAALSGAAASATGQITFTLYGPDDATCARAPVFTSARPVSSNGSYASADFVPTAAGTYRWKARYGGDARNAAVGADCNAQNESVVVTTPRTVAGSNPPDLAITKTASPATATVGSPLTYQLSVRNVGTGPTTGLIRVTDDVPARLSISSVSGSGWACSQAGQAITCTQPGPLAAGTTASPITFVTAVLAAAGGEVVNTGVVKTPGDTDTTNDTSAVTTPVLPASAPALHITKSAAPAPGTVVAPGQLITYTLGYSDTGDAVARFVDLSDSVPANTAYVPDSATCSSACLGNYSPFTNMLHWTVSIKAGKAGSVSFQVRVSETAPDRAVIRNVGMLSFNGTSTSSNPVEHPVTVPVGGVRLVKSVSAATAAPGDTLTYSLVATATAVAHAGVTVTDVVPAGTTYVAGSASCGSGCLAGYDPASRTITGRIVLLPAGASQFLSFRAVIDRSRAATDGETIRNVAILSTPIIPSTPSNVVITTVPPTLIVLGERIPQPAAPVRARSLPFTGANGPTVPLAIASLLLIGCGAVLSRPRRRRATR